MNQLEINVKKSFSEVRKDIIELKNQVLRIADRQQELSEIVGKSEAVCRPMPKAKAAEKIKTVKPKTKAKRFVAAKEGKKFHIPECPYAQNIKPKSLVKFKTKNTALNKGYKACTCVK